MALDREETDRGFIPAGEAARRLGLDEPAWREAARRFPMRWPKGYLEIALSAAGAPVRRMGAPEPSELVPDPGDLPDPVGEGRVSPHPFVVRKHRDRAILLVTARCHFYCRFCFRRSFPDGEHRSPTPAELEAALEHLLADPDLREVILSGGDPLVLEDERIGAILARIARAPGIETVRVHTRAPVHYPERITDRLVSVLAAGKPLWLATHFNHPVELTEPARAALARLRRGGIAQLNQSVLLAGVNDAVEPLERLCRELYRERVLPYALHHPDRAPGNAAFRVTIRRGLEIHAGLRQRLPGPALPAYLIDLPDGSGKVPVTSLEHLGGRRYRSPGSGVVIEDIEEERDERATSGSA